MYNSTSYELKLKQNIQVWKYCTVTFKYAQHESRNSRCEIQYWGKNWEILSLNQIQSSIKSEVTNAVIWRTIFTRYDKWLLFSTLHPFCQLKTWHINRFSLQSIWVMNKYRTVISERYFDGRRVLLPRFTVYLHRGLLFQFHLKKHC